MAVKMLKKINLDGYDFIEGFPGAGLVGPMAVSYLINKLKMDYIGYIESDSFPPLVSIHNAQPLPLVRFYASQKNNIVTAFSEFAIPLQMVAEMSSTIYDFVKKGGMRRIYSIGGIPQPSASPQDAAPFSVASMPRLSKETDKAGLKPIAEGVSTGVSAVLLLKSALNGTENINIMVPIQQNIVDPMYAETALRYITKMIGITIDMADLDKEAKMIESKIKELLSKHKEVEDDRKKIDGTGPSMYA